MTGQPRLLDLFCCAGGAAEGYARAGFEVVGVDLRRQDRYPFEFHQADAMSFPLAGFDAVHASPPCQRYTKGAGRWGTRSRHADLIAPVRRRLLRAGVPYVIENVEQARAHLRTPIRLCGTMFGLGVFRHRLFESSVTLTAPAHVRHSGRVGDGRYFTVAGHTGGHSTRDGWVGGTRDDWRAAMGIGWMMAAELAEAIPPAYTEHVGRQLIAHLRGRV